MEISSAVAVIENLPQKSAPYIIAIDGFGGAGKSTLASKLAENLGDSIVVSMDDFIDQDHFYDDSWEFAFKRDAVGERIADLMLSRDVAYVIVEGISSMHPTLANLYDLTIWVDTPIAVAKRRGALRDAGNENEDKWDLWAANDLKYLNDYDSKGHADLILTNAS